MANSCKILILLIFYKVGTLNAYLKVIEENKEVTGCSLDFIITLEN